MLTLVFGLLALTTCAVLGSGENRGKSLPGERQSKVEENMLLMINIFGSDEFFEPSAKP